MLTILIILPLGTVLLQAVKPGLLGEGSSEKGASLLLEVFTRPLWSRALKNSLMLGICTTFFGTIFGAVLANLRVKWDFKAGRLMDAAAWILMIMPSFIIAQGWVYFASGNGVARAWLGWDDISSMVFSFPGLVFIMVLNKFPFAYVTIKSSLEWKPQRLSYAARVNGATAWEESEDGTGSPVHSGLLLGSHSDFYGHHRRFRTPVCHFRRIPVPEPCLMPFIRRFTVLRFVLTWQAFFRFTWF